MTTQKIDDYLTKELFISKNIVTYRLLSRELGIHVNVAKNELAAFYAKNASSRNQHCSATYLVSGEIRTPNKTGKEDEAMVTDVDTDYALTPTPTQTQGSGRGNEHEDGDGDVVVQIQMTVVTENNLDDAKAKYHKLNAVHVYSLSPSPIHDADLLCAPRERIREVDNEKGAEMASAVGRIVGKEIKMRESGTKAKGRPNIAAQPAPKLKVGPSTSGSIAGPLKADETMKEAVKDEPKKAKPTGKLNFFAPKTRAQDKPKETEKESKPAETKTKMFFGAAKSATAVAVPETVPSHPKETPKEAESVKRGIKRKSTAAVLDDEEENNSTSPTQSEPPSRRSSKPPSSRSSPQPAKAMAKLRLHKGAILSDEEGSGGPPRRKIQKKPRRKAALDSDEDGAHDSEAAREATKALTSMMDIDDEQVEKVSRRAKMESLRQEEEESEPESVRKRATTTKDSDVEMSGDMQAKTKPKARKRKEKKAVPVGRNGLKKRRVMKSRTGQDEKGYMVTEDYSSYESVDEEEEEAEEPAPATKRSGGKRTVAGKKRETAVNSLKTQASEDKLAAPSSGDEAKLKIATKSASSSTRPSTSRSGAAPRGGQKQKTLTNFFSAPKANK